MVAALADAGLTVDGPRRGRSRLRPRTVHRAAGRHGHRRRLRGRAGHPGARRVQPGRHRRRTPPATCWWSPTPAAARCTGRATATACGSRGPRSTPRPTCRPAPTAWPVRPTTPRCSICRGSHPSTRRRRVWCGPSPIGPRRPTPLVPLYLRRPDAKTLAEQRRCAMTVIYDALTRPTPPGAPSWRRSCSRVMTRGPRRRSCANSRPSTITTSPRGRTTSSSATPASPGWAGNRRTSTRFTPSASIRRTRARASAGGCSTDLLDFADGGAVFLEVRTDNDGRDRAVRERGFVNVGVRKRYYRVSGADAYTMRAGSAMTIILAIESSCDETGVGIAELGRRRHRDAAGRRGGLQRRRARPVRRRGSRDRVARPPGGVRPDDAPGAGRGRGRQARHRRGHHRARAGRCAAGGSRCGQGVFGRVAGAVLRRQPPRRAPGRRRATSTVRCRRASACWCPAGTPTCCTCGRWASRSSNSAAPSTTPRARPTTRSRGCSASGIPAARCSTTWPAPATVTRSCSRAA